MKYLYLTLCLLLTTTLFGQEWVRQNPFPELTRLNAVHFDEDFGLAVGRESVILYTEDRGEIWEQQDAPIDGWVMQAAAVVPGTYGELMYIGGNGLLKTVDGGATWEVVTNAVSNIFKIQVLSENEIIAIGSSEGLRSDDGMETWEVFDLAGNGSDAAHFLDFNNGWCSFGGFKNTQVYRTINGGLNWELTDTLRHPVITAIHMLDDQNGFLASRDWIMGTNNGGTSWDTLHDNSLPSTEAMHVVNESEIWVGLSNGFLFYTMDGGANWTQQNPNIINSNRIEGIFANEGGECWASGKFVTIQYTDDWGSTWIDQIPGVKHTLIEADFLDTETGFVCGLDGSVLRTTDGGAVWEDISLGNSDLTPLAIDALTETDVYLGTTNGQLRYSDNAGDSWTVISEGLNSINAIHIFDANTYVIVNEDGEVQRSTNGGVNWTIAHNAPSSLLDVSFVGLNGWAVGRTGIVIYSPDGGITWIEQEANAPSASLEDVEFVDGLTGWITANSFGDTLWSTTDGGQTWNKNQLPFRSFWTGISFMDQDTGWICYGSSGSGRIYRTNDAGQTWTETQMNPEAHNAVFVIKGEETVYAVGAGGNIMKYAPCIFEPRLDELTGDRNPCVGDTATYSVDAENVAIFNWSIPDDWSIFGNPNTSDLRVIVGEDIGQVSIFGRDACGVFTEELLLEVEPILVPEVVIAEMDGKLIVDEPGDGYQWFLDGNPIPGATGEEYTPTTSGTYFVIVAFDIGCTRTSNSIDVVISAVRNLSASQLSVYPNPTTGAFTIATNADLTGSTLRVYDLVGRLMTSQPVSGPVVQLDLDTGVYVLQVERGTDLFISKLVIRKK